MKLKILIVDDDVVFCQEISKFLKKKNYEVNAAVNLKEANESLQNLWLGYTESTGHPELREEIAKLHETAKAEHILVHSGAEEAIFNFMNSVLEPGDHIIVHFPAYQSLFEVAQSIGCGRAKSDRRPAHQERLPFDAHPTALSPSATPAGYVPAGHRRTPGSCRWHGRNHRTSSPLGTRR